MIDFKIKSQSHFVLSRENIRERGISVVKSGAENQMRKVLLVDAFPIWREGIKDSLTGGLDLEIVLESTDRGAIHSAVSKGEIGLVIMDLNIPGEDGFELLHMIRLADGDIPVLIFSTLAEETYGVKAIKEGAAGFLTKACSIHDLRTAVQKILSGKKYISEQLAQRLAGYIESGDKALPHDRLTTREFQVMLMIGQGMSLKEVADKLSLSYATIATHKSKILKKMELGSVAQVVKYVSNEGLSK